MSFMTAYARSEILLTAGGGDIAALDGMLAALLSEELDALEQACDLLLDRIGHRKAAEPGRARG